MTCLFVYGSLLSSIGHEKGERLRREARLLGPATLPASRLYRISWYPGLSESADAADLVHGEIYELTTPAETLAWLDEYEGIVRGPESGGAPDEYERTIRTAHFVDGPACDVFVYLYRRPMPDTARIASGRWTG